MPRSAEHRETVCREFKFTLRSNNQMVQVLLKKRMRKSVLWVPLLKISLGSLWITCTQKHREQQEVTPETK